jgi:hypothetical protein
VRLSDVPAKNPLNPTRLGPVSAAIFDELADGEWHHVEDVMAAGSSVVQPGFAIRRNGGGTGDPDKDVGRRAAGARAASRGNLERLRRHGRVEVDGQKVRMVPDCVPVWAAHRNAGPP